MDARVSRLEEEMGEVRAILRRIEPMIVRIDAQFPYLATKAEAERLRHDLSAEIASVRQDLSAEIASVRHDLSAEIASVRQDLSAEIASGRLESQGNIAAIREDLLTFRGDALAALESKPSRGAMWTMGIALFGLVVGGMPVGGVYLPFMLDKLHLLR